MKSQIRKMVAQKNIKRIEKELKYIEEQEAKAQLEPIEQPDDTFKVVNLKGKKERLLAELEKQKALLDENAEEPS